ncbi:MAG: hypothetical protein Q7U78_05910 [Gallionella sp.]|nr:hypothetical protein [Gallionella sp.]
MSAFIRGGMAERAELLGQGQTRQDLTVSRAMGVVYTNATGKVILLLLTVNIAANYGSAQLLINGLQCAVVQRTTATMLESIHCEVLPGETYTLQNLASSAINKWIEVR